MFYKKGYGIFILLNTFQVLITCLPETGFYWSGTQRNLPLLSTEIKGLYHTWLCFFVCLETTSHLAQDDLKIAL